MFSCLQMVQACKAVTELSDGIYNRLLHIQAMGVLLCLSHSEYAVAIM